MPPCLYPDNTPERQRTLTADADQRRNTHDGSGSHTAAEGLASHAHDHAAESSLPCSRAIRSAPNAVHIAVLSTSLPERRMSVRHLPFTPPVRTPPHPSHMLGVTSDASGASAPRAASARLAHQMHVSPHVNRQRARTRARPHLPLDCLRTHFLSERVFVHATTVTPGENGGGFGAGGETGGEGGRVGGVGGGEGCGLRGGRAGGIGIDGGIGMVGGAGGGDGGG